MKKQRVPFAIVAFLALLTMSSPDQAQAYIGPGAGFAFLSSFLALFVAFALALFYLLSWPLRFALKAMLRKGPRTTTKSAVDRVIVIGLDGMDPKLVDKFLAKGKLPNFQKLKEQGAFAPLATSYPSISPAAWSSFMTGVDPSHHNIFDFLTRDPCTYLPTLSSAEIGRAAKTLPLGKYLLPLGKPKTRLLRKSQPFWRILGEKGVFSSILRVPITFPPEEFNGALLSGMCTPDLKGSQGTFSFYTTKTSGRIETGGISHQVTLTPENTIHTELSGPDNSLIKGGGELKIPLAIRLDKERKQVEIKVGRQKLHLGPKTYSPWVKLVFRPGLGMKVHGICRFYVNCLEPDFELYVTPIHIDPENPALPISHPFIYSVYLAKMIGPYGTLGLAEDTWALNERILDEDAFLQQAYDFYQEREKMLFQALETTRKGLCVCVFDTTDRIQHMFFRCLDESHPANQGKEVEKYKQVIEDLYMRMDQLVGRVLERVDERTVLLVMSDHGFTQFRRGVNINTWLYQNGYLTLKDGKTTSGDWFKDVDWEKTKAFSLGLTGVFLNRKGRESQGIVEEGEEVETLKRELIRKLTNLKDEAEHATAIREVVDTAGMLPGPYLDDAPDLLLGYNAGYRNSWECAAGRVTEQAFEDNTKSWSGDHCVDPTLVPGVLFCNRKITTHQPNIKDIAPTVLRLFGVAIPPYMKGQPLLEEQDGRGPAQPEVENKGESLGQKEQAA